MGIVRFTAAGLICLLSLAPGIAASGFEANGLGVKATAMGGAFRAVADDWTAAYYNPAGYADFLDNQLGGNLALFQYRNEVTPDYRWPAGDGRLHESGILNDFVNYNTDEILNNPSGGFAVRLPVFGSESVFGFSIYQPFDYNVRWDLYQFPYEYDTSAVLPRNQYQNNFDIVAFQLTAAHEHIEDKLNIGIGLQLLRADLLFNEVIFRDNPSLTEVPVAHQKITQWAHNDGRGFGFGINLGAQLKQSENLTLGAVVNVPFTITATGNSKLEYYMPRKDEPDLYFGTVEHLLTAGAKVVDSATYEAKLKMPPSFGMGLAYQANEKVLVTLDAEYTLWSRFDGFNFKYSDHRGLTGPADTSAMMREFFTADVSNPVDWDNTFEIMAGALIDYSEYVTFMGGLAIDQSPARKVENMHPLFFDLGTKLTFSGGIQFHLDRWDFGISTSYTRQPSATVPELIDADANGNPENFAGVFKGATYQTVLAFNYRF